jgi:hypothetical protein
LGFRAQRKLKRVEGHHLYRDARLNPEMSYLDSLFL